MTNRGGNLLFSTYWLCIYQRYLHSQCKGWLLVPFCLACCLPGLSGPFLEVPSSWWVHPVLSCDAVPPQPQDSALAVVELWASCQLITHPVWVTRRSHPALQCISFELKTTGCDFSNFSTRLLIPLCNLCQPGLATKILWDECWKSCYSQGNVLLSLCPTRHTSGHWRKSG